MFEVEVKANVRNKESLIKQLERLGCRLSEPITQDDRVFIPRGSKTPVKRGKNVLRIRKQNDIYLFTLKQTQSNELDCIEKELEVTQPETWIEIIKLLGFVEYSHVHKIRQTAHYQNYEICLDEVEGLGTFVEVELLTDINKEGLQENLFQFLESIGIDRKDRVIHGYDILMQLKKKTL